MEHGRGAHREDPGLRARRVGKVRAVARREEVVPALHRERGAHPHVAVLHRQGAVREPAMRPRPRGARDEGGRNRAPVRQRHAVALHPRHRRAGVERHARPRHRPAQPDPRPRRGAGDVRPALDHGHPRRAAVPAQGVGHGERELHAGHAAADHRGLGWPFAAGHGLAERVPGRGEGAEGLRADGVVLEARHLRHRRGDAHVERGDVVGERAPAGDVEEPPLRVDPLHRAVDEGRAREARQPHEVDHQRVAPVMARDVAGQHAGIGRLRPGVHEREPRAGQGRHAPAAQDERVGMAAADEHEVAGEGQDGRHGGVPMPDGRDGEAGPGGSMPPPRPRPGPAPAPRPPPAPPVGSGGAPVEGGPGARPGRASGGGGSLKLDPISRWKSDRLVSVPPGDRPPPTARGGPGSPRAWPRPPPRRRARPAPRPAPRRAP